MARACAVALAGPFAAPSHNLHPESLPIPGDCAANTPIAENPKCFPPERMADPVLPFTLPKCVRLLQNPAYGWEDFEQEMAAFDANDAPPR